MGRYAGILILGAALLVGCSGHGVLPVLPITPDGDIVNDQLRDQEFQFETYLPVEVSIAAVADSQATRALATQPETVVVEIIDENGDVLFAGAAWDGEAVTGEFLILPDVDAVTVRLSAAGFETRDVVIEDPARYELIDRVHALRGAALATPDDRDGDGVPDVYDAFPDDYRIAFVRSIPSDHSLTVAFEDNYPSLGDGDYNDFIARYRIVEYLSSHNELVRLDGEAEALARGAMFNHEFGIVVRAPGQTGEMTVTVRDPDGIEISSRQDTFEDVARLVIFDQTRDAFRRTTSDVHMDNARTDLPPSEGYTAEFSLVIDGKFVKPQDQECWAPFDPYLLVLNTGYDIHLLGREPLPGSLNPDGMDGTIDENGYPRALLVPEEWLWPVDTVPIESCYPGFADWRETEGAAASDWYLEEPVDEVMPR